jgi:hypothetical protein
MSHIGTPPVTAENVNGCARALVPASTCFLQGVGGWASCTSAEGGGRRGTSRGDDAVAGRRITARISPRSRSGAERDRTTADSGARLLLSSRPRGCSAEHPTIPHPPEACGGFGTEPGLPRCAGRAARYGRPGGYQSWARASPLVVAPKPHLRGRTPRCDRTTQHRTTLRPTRQPPSPINNIIPARNNPVADEQLARMRTLSSVQSSGP